MKGVPHKVGRRQFLQQAGSMLGGIAMMGWAFRSSFAAGTGEAGQPVKEDPLARDWLPRWERYITSAMRNRYCDREMGEEIGWLVSPFLNGFYYGYLATKDTRWLDYLVDWSDSWVRRSVKEPDGYLGWPKPGGASTNVVPDLVTDNQLGEAMALRPMVRMASLVRQTPDLKAKYGEKAEEYLALAERLFEKWDRRGCWREAKEGGVWVVPPFGLDLEKGTWTEGYERRTTDGFSMPANKQNKIALWLLALYDATKKPIYRERAEKWWRQMRSRMRVREGKYYVWNYWDPAGPWDYKPDGTPKHWIGVHPNGGYYAIDVEGIVAAYEHGLVFDKDVIERLIATNRDFMWNGQVEGAKFQRIDGGKPDPRWQNTPGVLWTALVPYDATLRQVFEANHNPASWGGLSTAPWYIAWKQKNREGEGAPGL